MHTAAPNLASLRARLEALEARADARRVRDAERAAEPATRAEQREQPLRDAGAAWKAAQGRDWIAEAREDLAAVDAAPRASGRERNEVAPEYVDEVVAEEAAEEPAPPVSKVGGDSTDAPTVDAREGVGAPAGNPEGPSGVGAAPQSEPGACPPVSLARVPGSSPGRRAYPKLPQAVAREDWRARWERIERTALRASLAPVRSALDPFAWALARAGPGALG